MRDVVAAVRELLAEWFEPGSEAIVKEFTRQGSPDAPGAKSTEAEVLAPSPKGARNLICKRCGMHSSSWGHNKACGIPPAGHAHHWRIGAQHGPSSVGRCECGATREFANGWRADRDDSVVIAGRKRVPVETRAARGQRERALSQ